MIEQSYHIGKIKPGIWRIYQIQRGKRITLFAGKYPDVNYQWQFYKNENNNNK